MDTIHLHDARGNLIGHYSRRNSLLLTKNYQPSDAYVGTPGFAVAHRKNAAHRRRLDALIAWAAENDGELLLALMGVEGDETEDETE